MNLLDVIRAEKAGLNTGSWAQGHIPRTAFPLSRLGPKGYKFGPDYKWRLVKFKALGEKFRVLMLLNESKQIFRAKLGLEVAGDMTVLCEHEFHASEPGWHCHLSFADTASIPAGASRYDKKKWPKTGSKTVFGVTQASALTLVAERYNLRDHGRLLA